MNYLIPLSRKDFSVPREGRREDEAKTGAAPDRIGTDKPCDLDKTAADSP